jgi:hypothetical protein
MIVNTVNEAIAYAEQLCADQNRKFVTSMLTDAVANGLDLDDDQLEALMVEQRELQKVWLADLRRKLVFYSVHKRFPLDDAG